MMTRPNTPKPPFRWGRLVLVVSLALNLAVAGMIAGAAFGRFGHDHRLAARDISFGLFTESLGEEDRRALRAAWGDTVRGGPSGGTSDGRADRRDMRQDLAIVLETLRADPFDSAALRAALDTGADRLRARQTLGQGLLVDHLENMDTAARLALADRLEASLQRRSRRQ
jgi:uncharacterized membrane protein